MNKKSKDSSEMITREEFEKLSFAEQWRYLAHKREEINKGVKQLKI